MRNGESREPGLGSRTTARRTLVANLAARSGRSAGERRDRRRMIVRLDLHDQMRRLRLVGKPPLAGCDHEPLRRRPLDDGRIVRIGRKHAFRCVGVRVLDHLKEALVGGLSLDDPVGIEDFVPAMLRVGLREHHELHVRGIAADRAELLDEVDDLIVRQRQTQITIRGFERRRGIDTQIDPRHRPWLMLIEQCFRRHRVEHDGFHHPVVQ